MLKFVMGITVTLWLQREQVSINKNITYPLSLPFSICPEFQIRDSLSHSGHHLQGSVCHASRVDRSNHGFHIPQNKGDNHCPLQTPCLQKDLKQIPNNDCIFK